MGALAEDSLDAPGWRLWAVRITVAVIALLLLAWGASWLAGLTAGSGPKRQVAKIALLPDTPPPPPPPPPKEDKRPEPKPEDKPVVQPKEARPDEPPKPANEPIKMEGAAGDGPSAFQSGGVSKEYSGGAPVVGGAAASGAGGTDRTQERFYANTARQLLRDALESHLRGDAGELAAVFSVWLAQDGSIQRYELSTSGDAARDDALRQALDATSQTLKLPPPPSIPQPMRFRVTVRPLG